MSTENHTMEGQPVDNHTHPRVELPCKCGNTVSVIPSRLAPGETVECRKCGHIFRDVLEKPSIWKPN